MQGLNHLQFTSYEQNLSIYSELVTSFAPVSRTYYVLRVRFISSFACSAKVFSANPVKPSERCVASRFFCLSMPICIMGRFQQEGSMGTRICAVSFYRAETPCTSIKQQLTSITHNTSDIVAFSYGPYALL